MCCLRMEAGRPPKAVKHEGHEESPLLRYAHHGTRAARAAPGSRRYFGLLRGTAAASGHTGAADVVLPCRARTQCLALRARLHITLRPRRPAPLGGQCQCISDSCLKCAMVGISSVVAQGASRSTAFCCAGARWVHAAHRKLANRRWYGHKSRHIVALRSRTCVWAATGVLLACTASCVVGSATRCRRRGHWE